MIAALGIVLAFPAALQAEGNRKKDGKRDWAEKTEKGAKERIERLASELKLTDEQRSQVEEIGKRHRDEAKRLRDEFKEQMRLVREKKSAEIRALLSDDQKTKFDEMKPTFRLCGTAFFEFSAPAPRPCSTSIVPAAPPAT